MFPSESTVSKVSPSWILLSCSSLSTPVNLTREWTGSTTRDITRLVMVHYCRPTWSVSSPAWSSLNGRESRLPLRPTNPFPRSRRYQSLWTPELASAYSLRIHPRSNRVCPLLYLPVSRHWSPLNSTLLPVGVSSIVPRDCRWNSALPPVLAD